MKQAFLLLLLLLPLTEAIRIEAIYPNPVTEAGSEFVLLYNDETQPIILDEWTISTPTSATDATLQGTIAAGEQFLVSDTGWDEKKDNASWPHADYHETLTLGNTNGYVQLIDTESIVHDTIGYGDAEEFEGTPHPGASESEILVRTSYTNNNAADFSVGNPFTSTPTPTQGEVTTISVEVANSPSEILSVYIQDDDPQQPGIQAVTTHREVNVTIQDLNTLTQTLVFINEELVFSGSPLVEETLTQAVNVSNGTITVAVRDENSNDQYDEEIEQLDLVGISLPKNIDLIMHAAQNKSTSIPITNQGSTPVHIQIQGKTPDIADRLLGQVYYTLLGEEYTLEETFIEHAVALAPGEVIDMDLRMQAGYVPTGTYTGQLIIVGVPA